MIMLRGLVILGLMCPLHLSTQLNPKLVVHFSKISDHSLADSLGLCSLEVNNGVLTCKRCSQYVNVTTSYGQFSLPTISLHKRIFFGPFSVVSGPCTAMLTGLPYCRIKNQDLVSMNESCESGSQWITVLPLSLLMTTFIVLVMYSRYLFLKYHYKLEGYNRLSVATLGLGFVVEFGKPINKSKMEMKAMTSKTSSQTDSEEEDEPVIHHHKHMRVSGTQVLKYCLLLSWCFGFQPLIEGHSIGKLTLMKGQYAELSSGMIAPLEFQQNFPLQWAYKTSGFSVKTDAQWYCREFICRDNYKCMDKGPRGKWTSDKLNLSAHGLRTATREYCSQIGVSCIGGWGCWVWNATITLQELAVWDVYKIGQSYLSIHVRDTTEGQIKVIDAHLENEFSPIELSVVKSRSSSYYLCPVETNALTPKSGSLGDVQFNSDGYFTFSTDLVDCGTDWWKGPVCDSVKPFSDSLERICTPLPTKYGDYNLKVENGELIAERDGNLVMIVESSEDSIFKVRNASCGNVTIGVFGLRGGPFPFTMTAQTTGFDLGKYKEFSIPCSHRLFRVSCDNRQHQFETQDPSLCSSWDSAINMTIIDFKDIRINDIEHATTSYGKSGWDWSLNDFGSMIGSSSIMGLLSGNIVVIIVIVVLVCKR